MGPRIPTAPMERSIPCSHRPPPGCTRLLRLFSRMERSWIPLKDLRYEIRSYFGNLEGSKYAFRRISRRHFWFSPKRINVTYLLRGGQQFSFGQRKSTNCVPKGLDVFNLLIFFCRRRRRHRHYRAAILIPTRSLYWRWDGGWPRFKSQLSYPNFCNMNKN